MPTMTSVRMQHSTPFFIAAACLGIAAGSMLSSGRACGVAYTSDAKMRLAPGALACAACGVCVG